MPTQYGASATCWTHLGYPALTLQSDGEPSVIALKKAVVKNRETANTIKLSLRESPKDSHQSNGRVENAIGRVKGLSRTLRIAYELDSGRRVAPKSPLNTWLVRHAAYVMNHYVADKTGRTAHEKITLSQFSSPNFACG